VKFNFVLTLVETSAWSSYNSSYNSTTLDWTTMTKEECTRYNGTLFGTGCNTPHYVPNVFMVSCLLFIGTFILAMALKIFRNTRFFPNMVGGLCFNYKFCFYEQFCAMYYLLLLQICPSDVCKWTAIRKVGMGFSTTPNLTPKLDS